MDTPAACQIERLPEDLLIHVISLTSPGDAVRATTVSRAFHAAADSDTVWSRFLPSDLPQFAKNELPRRKLPSTNKGLFRRLADEPVLLRHKYMRMQLDKATGAKCFTLSSSALQTPHYSSWIPVGSDFDYSKRGKRFLQAIVLRYYPGLNIRAKVQHNMLSRNTTYVAYMVFKLGPMFYGLDFPFQEASFGVAGSESIRKICLQGYTAEDGNRAVGEPPGKHILPSWYPTRSDAIPPVDNVHFPRKKTDGWMEVEMGEFYNEEGDGEICISLIDTSDARLDVIVWGIELRIKQQRQ